MSDDELDFFATGDLVVMPVRRNDENRGLDVTGAATGSSKSTSPVSSEPSLFSVLFVLALIIL